MWIAFVTLGFAPLRTSGLDVSGERLVHGLLEAGHHVTVIAGARGRLTETEIHPALEIHRVQIGQSNWIGFAYRAARRLEKLAQARPYDIVHFWDVHFAYAYRGRYVASAQQSFRQRWGIWQDGRSKLLPRAFYFAYYSLARILAEIPAARNARGLLAGSSTTRDEFINHYGVTPERIVLTRHGIDTDFFCPDLQASLALRTRLGLNAEEPIILFVGFVTPRKGLEYLARALPLVRPLPGLVIVGRWNEKFRSSFLKMLGPAASQVVEAGFVPDEQMPAFYSMADVYVSPSLLEGFGLPLAESLACETPVVAADSGATAEVVRSGGILVPPRDPVALADAVSRLLNDPRLRQTLGTQGREHVSREFHLRGMVDAVLDAYKKFKS